MLWWCASHLSGRLRTFSLRRSRSRSKSSRGPDGLAVVGVAFLGTRLATFVYVSKLFFFRAPLRLFFPLWRSWWVLVQRLLAPLLTVFPRKRVWDQHLKMSRDLFDEIFCQELNHDSRITNRFPVSFLRFFLTRPAVNDSKDLRWMLWICFEFVCKLDAVLVDSWTFWFPFLSFVVLFP